MTEVEQALDKALVIEPGKTYVVQCDWEVSPTERESIEAYLARKTNYQNLWIVLDKGIHVVREPKDT